MAVTAMPPPIRLGWRVGWVCGRAEKTVGAFAGGWARRQSLAFRAGMLLGRLLGAPVRAEAQSGPQDGARMWRDPAGRETVWVDPADLDDVLLAGVCAYPPPFAPSAWMLACAREQEAREAMRGARETAAGGDGWPEVFGDG